MTTNNHSENKIIITVLLPLMALVAPFLVFLIEIYLPYPHIIEEIVKAIFVVLIINNISGTKLILKLGILTGFFFAASESALYLFNFLQLASPWLILQRVVLTSLLHSGTIIIMLIFGFINKKLLPLGVILGIYIHYLYNLFFM